MHHPYRATQICPATRYATPHVLGKMSSRAYADAFVRGRPPGQLACDQITRVRPGLSCRRQVPARAAGSAILNAEYVAAAASLVKPQPLNWPLFKSPHTGRSRKLGTRVPCLNSNRRCCFTIPVETSDVASRNGAKVCKPWSGRHAGRIARSRRGGHDDGLCFVDALNDTTKPRHCLEGKSLILANALT